MHLRYFVESWRSANLSQVLPNLIIERLGVGGTGFHLVLGGLFQCCGFIAGFPDGNIHYV